MQLSVSRPSSLRVPAITPVRSSASSRRRDGRGGKRTCQCSTSLYFKFSQSSPLLGASSPKSRLRPAPRRSDGRNLIQACARVGAAGSDPILSKVSEFKDACWRFFKPHSIRGTSLGSFSLVARALIENSHLIKWSLLLKAFSGLFALICGNGYIVGINQIYDIGIDKVNKPYLPVAAGDLSLQHAWLLVIFLQ